MSKNERVADRIIAGLSSRIDTEQAFADVQWMMEKYGELYKMYIKPRPENIMPTVHKLFIVKVLEEELDSDPEPSPSQIHSDALSDFAFDADREDRIFGRH